MKRGTGIALLALLLVALAFDAKAEESPSLGLGLAWAPIGGQGFSLRKIPYDQNGYQCGVIFWKGSENGYFNIGAEYLFVLKHTRMTALYVPVGFAFTYDRYTEYYYGGYGFSDSTDVIEDNFFTVGGGVGFMFRSERLENIWFSFDLVMVAQKDYIGPIPQVAAHYMFK